MAQNQPWQNTCVEQTITLHGMIPKSLPLMIVMDKGVVWKPGISMQVFVPLIGMTEAIYQKNIYISLVADVMLRVYKDPGFNIRSSLMIY